MLCNPNKQPTNQKVRLVKKKALSFFFNQSESSANEYPT